MLRPFTLAILTLALLATMSVSALANNPPGDPLPVSGEPSCFGARVSHSASEHGLTPRAKVSAVESVLVLLESPGFDPVWEDAYVEYWTENGVSVRTVQQWIRINCSDDPIIGS